jgi:hypothetical protein
MKEEVMNRKIIQITAMGVTDKTETIYALCDDGSVWRLLVTARGVSNWHQLPDLPQ